MQFILYSFVVCDLPPNTYVFGSFSLAKVVLFLLSIGIKTVFWGYKLFENRVKTIGFTTVEVKNTPVLYDLIYRMR